MSDEVKIEIQNKKLIIQAVHRPREGWAGKFETMSQSGYDQLLLEDGIDYLHRDEEEWEW